MVKLPSQHQHQHQHQVQQPSDLADQFPNVATFGEGQKQDVHENNYFKDMPLDEVHMRYVKFSVFMEETNKALDLPNTATIEQFAHRIRDIVYAQQRES